MKVAAILAVLSLVLFGAATPQAAAQDIAALGQKYDTSFKALVTARDAAMERLKASYLADLRMAEQSAGASGNVAQVGALMKTREAVAATTGEASAAPGLAKAHAKRHNDYLAALVSIQRQFAPRFQRLSGETLRSLNAVESRLPAASPAREQIAKLKEKIVLNGDGQKLTKATFENTIWLWMAQADKPWEFRPGGVIKTDRGHTDWSWRILSPNTFVVEEGNREIWRFTMDFARMEANGVHVTNLKDRKQLVYKGRMTEER